MSTIDDLAADLKALKRIQNHLEDLTDKGLQEVLRIIAEEQDTRAGIALASGPHQGPQA